MGQDKELEWNLAKVREKELGNVLAVLRQTQAKAAYNPSIKNIRKYRVLLQSTYLEVRTYINDDSADEIKKELKKAKNRIQEAKKNNIWEQESEELIEKLEEIDELISDARDAAGLDMPKSEPLDPENAAVEGLVS